MDETKQSCNTSSSMEGGDSTSNSRVIFENIRDSIPEVTTKLTYEDIIGGWKARWGINRMNYKIDPGLYKVGKADENSPVLVTANYKLTFDKLRKELSGIDAWILVLDTKGINVWCAAGKGTFGTEELIKRIQTVRLHNVVTHRKIILPQLGAPGVAAHIVEDSTKFKIVYGPIRAKDIRAFLKNNLLASTEMRKVKFDLIDRMVLIPMELVQLLKYIPVIFAILILIHFFIGKINIHNVFFDSIPYLSSIFIGTVIAPVLLPWIPFKAFSLKGWLLGIIFTLCFNYFFTFGTFNQIGNLLIFPAISSYIVLNFTGATTFTSLSGVKKELKYAIPAIIITLAGGIIFKVANIFI
jgi:hypothetical protein